METRKPDETIRIGNVILSLWIRDEGEYRPFFDVQVQRCYFDKKKERVGYSSTLDGNEDLASLAVAAHEAATTVQRIIETKKKAA